MSEKLPRVTAKQLLRALRRDGWMIVRQVGSHATLRHPTKPGRTVLPLHSGKTLQPGLLRTIIDETGLSADDIRSLL